MGVDAVAQMYRGIPTASMMSMAESPPPRCLVMSSDGIKVVITPARNNPKRNQGAISSHNSNRA